VTGSSFASLKTIQVLLQEFLMGRAVLEAIHGYRHPWFWRQAKAFASITCPST
jgi:hypothetical protein